MTTSDLALWHCQSEMGKYPSYLLRRRNWGTSHTQVKIPRRITLERSCLEPEIFSQCPLWSFYPTARCKQKEFLIYRLYLSKNLTRLSHWRRLAHSPHSKERRGI